MKREKCDRKAENEEIKHGNNGMDAQIEKQIYVNEERKGRRGKKE